MTYAEFCKKLEAMDFFKLIDDGKKRQILDGVRNMNGKDLDLIYEDFEIQEAQYQDEKKYHLDMAQKKADAVSVLVYEAESNMRKNELAQKQKKGLSDEQEALKHLDSLLNQ